MESSSSFVQHHEYLAFFLQQFSFEQKAERHDEESLRKRRRRTCRSDTVVSVFGVKKPPERKANLFLRFGCFIRPRESIVGSEFCFRLHRETCAGLGPEPSNEFSRVAKR